MQQDTKHPETAIVFRNIRGRIVPVRLSHAPDQALKKPPKGYNYGKAVVGIGGGAAIIAGTGLGVGEAVRTASRYRKEATATYKAWRLGTKFPMLHKSIPKIAMRQALQKRAIGQKLFVHRHKALIAGAAIGTAVASWGVSSIKKRGRGRPKKFRLENLGPVGTAAAAATAYLYYRRLGRKNVIQMANNIANIVRKKPTGTAYPIPLQKAFSNVGKGQFFRFRYKPK